MKQDIRWQQRFSNFQRSLKQLDMAMGLMAERELNELERQGVIQAFEYNYELAWNVLRDFFKYQGEQDIHGSRDAFTLAFNRGLVKDGDVWMDMIKKRQLTSHTYNEAVAEQIIEAIVESFYPAFVALNATLQKELEDDG